MSRQVRSMNKKKKFVADGVFHAELHAFLSRSLETAGYAGIEVRVTPVKTEIRIKAAKVPEVIGKDGGRKIRELTSLVQKRFGYKEDAVELTVERLQNRGLCAAAQAENCKYKLMTKVPVRLAASAIIRSVLKDGHAKGCEVTISGKLKQQRAKSMKFREGYMIHSGEPRNQYIDYAVRHVFLKQGIMGVKVKIMLPYDPTGKAGVKVPLPDHVEIFDAKQDQEEEEIRTLPQGQQEQQQQQETQQ